MIYLDNCATTKMYDDVAEYMKETAADVYGNPSSLHIMGVEAERRLKRARNTIADSLKTVPGCIYFTSGATEANNLAVFGVLRGMKRGGRHLITSTIEHPSVLEIYKYLETEGYETDYLEVDSTGVISPSDFEEKLRADTVLVSLMHVNNETGAVQPVNEIGRIIKAKGHMAKFHVDAVQSYGKLLILPGRNNIDILTFSSHKIHGPKGAGGLFVEKGTGIKPVIFGGGQESGLRSGTENLPAAAAFGKTVAHTFADMPGEYNRIKRLKEDFYRRIAKLDHVVNSNDSGSPYILNVSFPGLRSEVILHHLESKGIIVSSGSACSGKKAGRSHVLTAMGKEEGIVDSAIRFSFGTLNTADEIEEAAAEVVKTINSLSLK